ncbi:CHU large protein [Sporocytophaga myxococcoides]|uniref:CHU large protein n=1 Tax=Sporocytophaga myxococcoides TaxID=153721 RepID=A0A098LMM7_9BACT|nr:gliding motility-associated C-terminal domain-containing protein [Sporocytophaga myxococcoides]GAL87707.1 CHU large protein [Sporocytophaga myxococcoides]
MYSQASSSTCDPATPSFVVDLSGNSDSAWFSPSVVRQGLCCGLDPNASPPLRCIEFVLTLDTGAQGIRFDIASGAVPSGSLGYQINCGPYKMVGENICLDGAGPHRLTFCKPGANRNIYTIVSIPKPNVTPPVTVSDNCSATLTAEGFDPSTIQWTSVPYNSIYNSYLNCTSACSTVTATYQPGAPPYIDYQVSGVPIGGCNSTRVTRTTRVYFVNDKAAQIMPKNPTVCFGNSDATITAYGTGGAPPYTYLWSTGETTQSIDVGEGKYWVRISDATSCPAATDTVIVTSYKMPITADAGPDLTSCANNPSVGLSGTVAVATGGVWSGGTGTFSPSNNSLNATYTPSSAEVASGNARLTLTTTGNGSCPPAEDDVIINIVPAPVVNAGADRTICGNNAFALLNGTVTNAGGGTWTGGSGTFSPNSNSLIATYYPSAAEITSGSVTLMLTSTGNGTCLPVSDNVIITITPSPVINAGPDLTICANNSTVNLSATVSVASGLSWTGGTGSFSPNRNVLQPSYIPSAAEIAAGFALLTVTSTGNGNCLPVSDDVRINITPAPVVNAGADRTVCANNPTLALSGSVTVAAGGVWSGGTGTFTPSANTLNASYTPSNSEIAAGKVTLTLTSTGNGLCSPVSDNMVITITPAPIVDAGTDITVCANNSSVSLSGIVTIATGGQWSGGTGTFSPNSGSLATQYNPSASEIAAGSVILTLTSTGNGSCLQVSDNLRINITPAPTVNAGPDLAICATVNNVALNGSVTVASGGTWRTSGTGSFTPNANVLNASYVPSASDKSSGNVTLTLTSIGNGTCIPVTDNMNVTISPVPVVNAGPPKVICADAGYVELSGTVSNASGGIWTSTGTGAFSPANSSLNTNYNLSPGDRTPGVINFTLTSTGNGVCSPVSSQTQVTVTPAPAINAGTDITACSDVSDVQLNGSVSIATGGIWSTSGSGSFSPSPMALNARYIPSPADKAAGSVIISIVSTGNGTCFPVTDQMQINFTPSPIIDAGPDVVVCSDNPAAVLTGSVTVATGGTWTGGAGVFSPGRNSMSVTYTPTVSEILMGSVVLTLTSTGNGTCIPVSDNVVINISPAPIVDAGPDQNLCGNVNSIQINGTVLNVTSYNWTTGGTGVFTNANALNTDYFPTTADTASHSITFELSVTPLTGCSPASDVVTINFTQIPVIDAGSDQTVCENDIPVQLQASGAKARWSGGDGTFYPNDSTLNASYTPSAAELTAGSVALTLTTIANSVCPQVTDNVAISFIKGPVVNVGPDITVCADTAGVPLIASVSNSSGVKWTSTGTGVFSPNDIAVNPTYIPSAADVIAGNVILTLSTTGATICDPVSDYLILRITPAPIVNAGFDNTVCADTSSVQLNGSVTNAGGGVWTTTGLGSFAPGNASLNASYFFTNADTAAHQVTFTLTSTGNGLCKPVSDQVVVNLTPVPFVSAGSDIQVCMDVTVIPLSGLVANTSGMLWSSTGSGYFTPSPVTNAVEYYPSVSDRTSGTATLTLMANATGVCNARTHSVTLSFTPAPTADAGPDQTICADSSMISLQGAVTVASGGAWSTNGSGTFTSPSSLVTAYLVSAEDSAAGKVSIILTTTGNGTCNPVTDEVVLTITPAPTIYAGPDVTHCSDVHAVNIFGLTTVATGGIWTSSGTGIFSPDAAQFNTAYIPSATDTANGSVVLTITSTGNGTCKAVSDQMIINLTPAPIVEAGVAGPICIDIMTSSLNGMVYNAGGGVWSTSGSGTFSNANNLMTDYLLSSTDKANTVVTLYLTSTGNGTCNPVVDSLVLDINPGPLVNAGVDQIICADADSILLSGEYFLAGGAKWSSAGSGLFTPSDTSMIVYYKPSAADTSAGSVKIYLTTFDNMGCNPVTDSLIITLTPAPVINAGTDQLICVNQNSINLSGVVGVATGGMWESSGAGAFNPGSLTLNTSYTIAPADTSAGVYFVLTSTGNGTCKPVKDTLFVAFQQLPEISSSAATICADNSGAPLSGQYSKAQGLKWTTTGTGNFLPSDVDLNITYYPSPADFSSGNIQIQLSTTGNGVCPPATADIAVTVKPAPVIDAGTDKVVCADNPSVNINGTVANAAGGIWSSSGTGSISPDPTLLNVTYYPSDTDIASGKVQLYFTTTGNGDCFPRVDSMLVTITPKPVIYAGEDQLICPNQTSVMLNATVNNAGGGLWSTIGTGTHSAASSLNNTYTFSAADYSAGPIRFIVTSTGNGLCQPVEDTLLVSVFPLPDVFAGADQAVCRDVDAIAFSGGYTIASGATWYSTGTGVFSNPNTTITVYYPSDQDKDNGLVKIYYKTILANTCRQVIDTANLYITPIPLAQTIEDQMVCVDTDQINLSGNITNATGGGWTTSGSGVFLPDTSDLNASYIISAQDRSAGFVRLILTTSGNSGCSNTDSVNVTIYPVPDITLGNGNACIGDQITLNAQPSNIPVLGEASFSWEKENTSLQYTTSSITVTEPGLYKVRYQLGACFRYDEVNLSFHSKPTPQVKDMVEFCMETQKEVVLDGGPADRYLWTKSGNTEKQEVVNQPGMYYVQVFNEFNCSNLDSIKVVDICPPRVFVPGIFTPDHDDINDVFKTFGKYFTAYKFTVFNRWGEIIFYTEDPTEAWDGTYLGEPMPNGVYPWILYYEGLSERYKGPFKEQGSVTVDR